MQKILATLRATLGNKRALRTGFQVVVALITAVPVLILSLPAHVQAAPLAVAVGAWIAIVSRIINALEDAGIIPAWLKSEGE